MLYILSWLIYGLIVGILGKLLISMFRPEAATVSGFFPTVLTGIVGSYVGGAINYVLFNGGEFIEPSGILMGIVGAAVALYGLYYYNTQVK